VRHSKPAKHPINAQLNIVKAAQKASHNKFAQENI
jgi:hypothetical protein